MDKNLYDYLEEQDVPTVSHSLREGSKLKPITTS